MKKSTLHVLDIKRTWKLRNISRYLYGKYRTTQDMNLFYAHLEVAWIFTDCKAKMRIGAKTDYEKYVGKIPFEFASGYGK